MIYAPVLILTLNRYDHFRRCIESLLNCTLAGETELYIALDFPSKPSHWDGYNKIMDYIPSIVGFKQLHLIQREKNYGEALNSTCSQELVLSRFDRMIYTEDDNEFSKNYLEYMNKGLELFQNDHSIAAICSLGGLLDIPQTYRHNYMYINGFSAWGFGTWRNRMDKQYFSVDEVRSIFKDRALRTRIRRSSHTCYYALFQSFYNGSSISGDSAISLYMIINGKQCIYPTVSKVRNFGHDGSGIHGGDLKQSRYSQIVLDSEVGFEFSQDVPRRDKSIESLIKTHDRFNQWKQFKLFVKFSFTFFVRRIFYKAAQIPLNLKNCE